MHKKYRLKKNYQFRYVYKNAEKAVDKFFVLLYAKRKNNSEVSQVGFSVSKKYGNAVARNKLTRQLKAVVRSIIKDTKVGYNIVVIPRKNNYTFEEIEKSVIFLFRKAKLID